MYTNFEKEKLGKTFQYYRHKNNVKWDIINRDSSISKNIYTRMYYGKIYEKSEYYDEFIRFFNLSFVRKKGFEIWFEKYTKKLSNALEYFIKDQIEECYREFCDELENYKNYPIYEQYYKCLEYIFRYYYKNEYLRLDEIELCIVLIQSNMLEELFSSYLLEIMYISNNNSIGNDELRRRIAKLIQENTHPILYQIKANNEKCERRMSEALVIHEKQLKIWNEKKNEYRIVKTLNGMLMIYKNIDIEKSYQTINELNKRKESNRIPETLKKSINYNIAMFYYVNQKYEEAYPIFIENINKYNGIQDMVILGYICSKLDKELPECYDEIDYSHSSYKEYIDYYRMKKEGRKDKDLVNYIMTVLIHEKLSKDEYMEPMWTIYEYEIYKMLEKSKKHYKSYIEFIKIRDKVVKYA